MAAPQAAGAAHCLGPSLSAMRDAVERLTAVVRRRAGQLCQLKQTSGDALGVLGPLVAREPGETVLLRHSWWQGVRVPNGTSTSQTGKNSPRRTASSRSRPRRPNSPASSLNRRTRTPASRRPRCASTPSTPRASWRGSPSRRRTPRSGLLTRYPPSKAGRPRPGTPNVAQRDRCACGRHDRAF